MGKEDDKERTGNNDARRKRVAEAGGWKEEGCEVDTEKGRIS